MNQTLFQWFIVLPPPYLNWDVGKKMEAWSTESFLWCEREHCFATAIQQCCCHKWGSLDTMFGGIFEVKEHPCGCQKARFSRAVLPFSCHWFLFLWLIYSDIFPYLSIVSCLPFRIPTSALGCLWVPCQVAGCPSPGLLWST